MAPSRRQRLFYFFKIDVFAALKISWFALGSLRRWHIINLYLPWRRRRARGRPKEVSLARISLLCLAHLLAHKAA